jgi:GNAT superfamily N-acetyltransferase
MPELRDLALAPFDPNQDAAACHERWMQALGPEWPLSEAVFRSHARQGTVARSRGHIVGAALTSPHAHHPALVALFVHPRFQDRGVGSALHEAVLDALRAAGANSARLGGGDPFLWPGVPENLPAARRFFQRRGWDLDQVEWDMAMVLRPGPTMPSPPDVNLVCRLARPDEVGDVAALNARHFPEWTHFYEQAQPERIMVARRRDEGLAGCVLLDMPGDREFVWSLLLGQSTAEIGAVGVDPALHGQGVGTSLMSAACDYLRSEGVHTACVRWLTRLNFYGRVGFTVWRGFRSGYRPL